MPRPMGHIRILMSSRVLLDLEDADKIFKEKGAKDYADYMRGRGRYKKAFDPDAGGRRLKMGPLWNFAVAAAKLNKAAGEPVVELGLVCKDDAETALPIFRNIDLLSDGKVEFHFRMATAGNDLDIDDHKMFGTDLFLTRNHKDAQYAVNNGLASAAVNFPPRRSAYEHREGKPVRIWVDGDAVAFGSSAEVDYREKGLDGYRKGEFNAFARGIEPGPFTGVLVKISQLNRKFSANEQPFRISLLTARGDNAAARVCTIAEQHGIIFNDRMIWMGGAAKLEALKAHVPDLYFDDQMVHLEEASKYCPTGLVAYPEGSPMHEYLRKKSQENEDLRASPRPESPPPQL